MMTNSGAMVGPRLRFPQLNGTPTIEDVALGQGRLPRFAGQGRRWYSVLLHSLVVHAIVMDWAHTNYRLRLLALVHDAHEVVTGDVPTTSKNAGLKAWQKEVDERLYKAWKLEPPDEWEHQQIKYFDGMALAAEGLITGPPNWTPLIVTLPEPTVVAFGAIDEYLELFPTQQDSEGLDSPAVKHFLSTFNYLQSHQ